MARSLKQQQVPQTEAVPIAEVLQGAKNQEQGHSAGEPVETLVPPESGFRANLAAVPVRTVIHTVIQPKLMVGAANDSYEQEADRIAAQVVQQIYTPDMAFSGENLRLQHRVRTEDKAPQMKPITPISAKAAAEDEELQRSPLVQPVGPESGEVSTDCESEINRARGSGNSLTPKLQSQMGQAMGADFSKVRVHTDGRADALTRSVGARAFTTGQDLFFKRGEYQPRNLRGQTLIAHELTHVLQQNGQARLQRKLNIDNQDVSAEQITSKGAYKTRLNNIIVEEARPRQLETFRVRAQLVAMTKSGNYVFATKREAVRAAIRGLINLRLGNGVLSWETLEQTLAAMEQADIEQLDPKSDLVQNLLKYPLQASWSVAKAKLAKSSDPKKQALMQKFWDFRQWHHQHILEMTKAIVNADTGNPLGLTDWAAAGSTTLTSDIDVNLKGEETEYAVKVFNQLFKQSGWPYEAGVVYDVNVYALDYMHREFTFGKRKFGLLNGDASELPKVPDEMLRDESLAVDYTVSSSYDSHGNLLTGQDRHGNRISGKEGVRTGRPEGGFSEEIIEQVDEGNQQLWALVKMRLYMTPAEWIQYCHDHAMDRATFDAVNDRYNDYVNRVTARMKQESGKDLIMANALCNAAQRIENTGHQNLEASALELSDRNPVQAENLMIGSSNRIYEEKLIAIATLRKELQAITRNYDQLVMANWSGGELYRGINAIDALKQTIEMMLVELRQLLGEATLYSNEAYLTDAAVNHAVVGMQSQQPIAQTLVENMAAVNENLADSLKEVTRHGDTLGEAAFKAAKYMWRMADAAKNMSPSPPPEVQALYNVGYWLADQIKNRTDLDAHGQYQESASHVRELLGVSNVPELRARIIHIGGQIRALYQTLVEAGVKTNARTLPVQSAYHP